MQQIGLKTVQLALDPLRENPEVWGKTKDLFREKGIIIVSGMFGTIGEDYTTMETMPTLISFFAAIFETKASRQTPAPF